MDVGADAATNTEQAANGANDFPDISDYAAIGDCRTAALISKSGAVEWLCLPTFSGTSIFAALIDRNAGHFSIRPTPRYRVERAYIDGTNVLQTTYHCDGGVMRLTDCITIFDSSCTGLSPQHEMLRIVECLSGQVPVDIEFAPKIQNGRTSPKLVNRGQLGWQCIMKGNAAFLRSDIALTVQEKTRTLMGNAVMHAGETNYLSFAFCEADICPLPLLGNAALERLNATIAWWQQWSGRCQYQGPYRNEIVRSLLALKLLTCCLSGAVIAALTTSLPETIGGTRNWDYRYCWLRDSALVLHAFIQLGYKEEAEAFLNWLLHATRLTWPRLQVLYDVYGETKLHERELRYLHGYRNSAPVRIGNAAHAQLQLDIYGELIATVGDYVDHGGQLNPSERRMLGGLYRSVRALWRTPDQGIWESRGAARHHTYSKAMCYIALDRLRHINRLMPLDIDDAEAERECGDIRDNIEKYGFDESVNAYVGYFGGKEPDASLLLMARYGYHEANHPRMLGTFQYIEQQLSDQSLVYRFPPRSAYDGISSGEGAFTPCCFWAVEYLANIGKHQDAVARFEHLLGYANDVGLFGEEIDPSSGKTLGNFPQAFTHVSLISAALALEQQQ